MLTTRAIFIARNVKSFSSNARMCGCFIKNTLIGVPQLAASYCTIKEPVIPSSVIQQASHEALFPEADPSELADLGRNLKPSFNLAAYANQSKTLQLLVDMGVELYKYDKQPEVARFILQLDFEKDIKPYVQFLCDNGVDPDNLSTIFSKNIMICQETLDDLHIRINYLESKKFEKEMIANIITKNPFWLSTPVELIDSRLGWLQKKYNLSGDEVRSVVCTLPIIVTFPINTIKLNNFVFEEEMGMTKISIKKMLLRRPRLFVKNQKKLLAAFEFVHKEMKVPVDRICHQPDILMCRLHNIRDRHLFLQSLGRAQYNPVLPGYISLDSIAHGDDISFVTNVAKASIHTFNLFLKSL